MPRNFFDELKKVLTDRKSNAPPALVSNLHGVIEESTLVEDSDKPQSWFVLPVETKSLPSLRDFAELYSFQKLPYETVTGVNGVVRYPESGKITPGISVGFFSKLTTAGPTRFPISVSAPGHQIVVYVDGAIHSRSSGILRSTVEAPGGDHIIAVLTFGGTAPIQVSVPAYLSISQAEPTPPAPLWAGPAVVSYLKAGNGSYKVDLAWHKDALASAWSVYRCSVDRSGVVSNVVYDATNPTATVTIDGGDYENTKGRLFFYDHFLLGTLIEAVPIKDTNSAITGYTLTVDLDEKATAVAADVIGKDAYRPSERYSSLARVSYGGEPTVRYSDTTISEDKLYVYRVTAFGFVAGVVESDYSEPNWAFIKDLDPPGNITFNPAEDITILNGEIILNYDTPVDEDYKGVRVYFQDGLVQTPIISDEGVPDTRDSLSFRPPTAGTYRFRTYDWSGNEQAEDEGVAIIFDGNGVYLVTFVASIDLVFDEGDDTLYLTAVGGPKCQSVLLEITDDETFATVPNTSKQTLTSGNTVSFSVALTTADRNKRWYGRATGYDGPIVGGEPTGTVSIPLQDSVFVTEEFGDQPPVLTIRQLTAAEQSNFVAPYSDTLRYAIVIIDARDPVDDWAGVTLWYQLKGAVVESLPAISNPLTAGLPDDSVPAIAPYELDDPLGTRSRYIAVSRTNSENWLRFWAVDGGGMRSHEMTFVVDFDSTPEIASIESELDTSVVNQMGTHGIETVDVAADDDTRSIKFWLDNAETNSAVGYTEPTEASPLTISDTAQFGSGFTYAFALGDGWKKIFNVQPFSGPNLTGEAGAIVQRTFARPPRTDTLFEHRNVANETTATTVKGTFQVFPAIEAEYSGTVSSATVNTVSIAAADWTADQWATFDQNYHFLYMTSGAAKDQVLAVVSNTTTQLTLGGFLSAIPAAGDTFQILDGVTYYRYADDPVNLTKEVAFNPTYTPIYIPRGDGKTIEFYSVLNDVPAESIHRVLIDPDNSAGIGKLSLTKLANGDLQVAIDQLDDDLRYWRSFEKKGAWPTLGGTTPTEQLSTVDIIDTHYLRFEGDNSEQSYRHSAGVGVWYVIVVPYNSYNEPGIPRIGFIDLAVVPDSPDIGCDDSSTGGSDNNGSDTNIGGIPKFCAITITAADVGTAYANQIEWTHDAGVPEDATNLFVKVFAWSSLEPTRRIELTEGLSYFPTYDCAPPDNPLTNTVVGEGSILHTGLPQRGTASDTKVTWTYEVWLYNGDDPDPLNFFLIAQYPAASFTDYYVLPTPHIDSAFLSITSGQGSSSGCSSQQVNRIGWTPLVNPAGEPVYFEISDINGIPVASGIAATAPGFNITQSYYNSTAGGNTPEDYQYTVKVKRKSDNVVVSSQTTNLVTVQHKQCTASGGAVEKL